MIVSDHVWEIQELTRYLKRLLDSDPNLQEIWVRGEISNFKLHSAGHMYFTLKDSSSNLRCVMFRGRNDRLPFLPEDGMRVIVSGYIGIYEKSGQYQLYATEMQPDGLGSVHLALEQLKRSLAAEGLFDPAHKRALPMLPRKVGVVTSATGAAVRDILTVMRRRYPNIHIVIAPVNVQGIGSAAQIAAGIQALQTIPEIDVIIVGRGGGAYEELQSFNTEIVARAIYGSRIPVVSAVGHETDFTIADLVADLRAPTPSAAAEMVVPEKAGLERHLNSFLVKMLYTVRRRLALDQNSLASYRKNPVFRRPKGKIRDKQQNLDTYSRKLAKLMDYRLQQHRQATAAEAGRLNALSPLSVLGRGYSICRRMPELTLIRRSGDVAVDDNLEVTLTDGKIYCQVHLVQGDEVDGQAKVGC